MVLLRESTLQPEWRGLIILYDNNIYCVGKFAMKKWILLILILSVWSSLAFGDLPPPQDESRLAFKVLWYRSADYTTTGSGGDFEELGNALESLGATITELDMDKEFTSQMLSAFDLVIICDRTQSLTPSEQNMLVKYVRNGGSLLVIADGYYYAYPSEPVLINFGIVVTGATTGWKDFDYFVHPATTKSRPVDYCEADYPYLIQLSGKAKKIGGRDGSSSPAAGNCIIALGGNSGKGRVIAVADSNIWLSNS
jgi:hypothetical protein